MLLGICNTFGSSLCTIVRYPFLVTDTKIFLKVSWAPIYINLRGSAPKQNAFFGLFFFKNLPAAQKNWSKCGLYSDLGKLRNQFGRPRGKKSAKLSIRPSRENLRSAPG